MKTKWISRLWVLVLLLFFSCKKELEPQESSGNISRSKVASPTVLPEVTPGVTANSNQTSSILQQNSGQAASVMNPAHGQAGHRCDIAVGAPLNSPPGKSNKNPTAKTSMIATTTPIIAKSNDVPVVTKPGMNPPHGQAGHRCDIVVGEPLVSTATKTIPATTNSSPPTQVPAMLKLDSTATVPK